MMSLKRLLSRAPSVRAAVDRAATRLRRHMEPRGRLVDAGDFSIRVPLGYDDHRELHGGFRIGVVCHLFFPDLCDDIRASLDAIPFAADVMITTDTPGKRDRIGEAFLDWTKGRVTVAVVENRGRDIAPKLTTFRSRYGDYDLLLFVHSKKSTNVAFGDAWRGSLLGSLVGSEAIVRSIVEIFARQPHVGMVAAQHFEPIRRWVRWNGNYHASKALAARMGFRIGRSRRLDFPSGSMFWARPRALRPLLDLNLQPGDFPPEEGQTNAALHHAIERLFFLVCEDAGYAWVKVSGSTACGRSGEVLALRCPSELDLTVDGKIVGAPPRRPGRAPPA